jgi:hypothetical protein
MENWEVVKRPIEQRLTSIEKLIKENREVYLEVMRENRELAKKNSELVREMVRQREEDRILYSKNKELYIKYLESIDSKEESIGKIVKDLEKTSNAIKETINSPLLFSRMHNYQWRMFSGISVTPQPFIQPREQFKK